MSQPADDKLTELVKKLMKDDDNPLNVALMKSIVGRLQVLIDKGWTKEEMIKRAHEELPPGVLEVALAIFDEHVKDKQPLLN